MAKKESFYRGVSITDLQAMPESKVIELLPARARRTFKRPLNDYIVKVRKQINLAIQDLKSGKNPRRIKTHQRSIILLPSMVGLTMEVYTGQKFEKLTILPEMIGHYVGEYVLTRKRVQHGAAGVGATGGSRHVAKK